MRYLIIDTFVTVIRQTKLQLTIHHFTIKMNQWEPVTEQSQPMRAQCSENILWMKNSASRSCKNYGTEQNIPINFHSAFKSIFTLTLMGHRADESTGPRKVLLVQTERRRAENWEWPKHTRGTIWRGSGQWFCW